MKLRRSGASLPNAMRAVVTYFLMGVLIAGALWFGSMARSTEMGLLIAGCGLCMAFTNLDKFQSFKGAGFEAEMRKVVDEVRATAAERCADDNAKSPPTAKSILYDKVHSIEVSDSQKGDADTSLLRIEKTYFPTPPKYPNLVDRIVDRGMRALELQALKFAREHENFDAETLAEHLHMQRTAEAEVVLNNLEDLHLIYRNSTTSLYKIQDLGNYTLTSAKMLGHIS